MFAASSASAVWAQPTAAASVSGRRTKHASSSRRSITTIAPLRVTSQAIADPPASSVTPAAVATGGVRQKAIVIGGGVGGLGTASRLAHAGYEVTILEKNDSSGGRCRSESFAGAGEGYRFDTGPSLMLLPDRYREQFTAVGKNMEDYMEIKRVDPAYRAHFGDHTTLDLLYDIEQMRKQMDEVEFGAGGRYIDWLGRARASLDYGVAAFIERDSNSILDFVDISRVGPLALAVNPIDLLLPQYQQMKKYFKDERLRALFSYQELYVGLSPYNAPGVFSLLAATELTDGVWYPTGGFDKVRESLQRLCDEAGATTKLNAEVAAILTEPMAPEDSLVKGSKATQRVLGVRLASGEVMEADVVVANPDLPCVWEQLMDHETFPEAKKEAERWEDADYSCSVIEFNWCLDIQIDALLHHNVFLSGDYKGSWVRPVEVSDLAAPKQHNFYCHNPVYTDPTCAPEGGSSIMVLLPVGNMNEQARECKKRGVPVPSEAEMVAAGREAILRRFQEAGHGDLRAHIKHEAVTTPSEWKQKFNIKHGAVFGLSHGLTQLAAFRPPVRTGIPALDSPEVDGLHFVGASTRPGNGVPLVLMGVKVVFEAILAKHGAGLKAASK
mmetsp:Transcript_32448/g.80057  ORF Transcript_32448/g.80057 Transcript_32448/m.80057 type:complete len:612 (+) Transcript_32448:58-1893(+)|eukprot:CAMPEP_0197589470 /NCGR_PEP_ID=MMETSP1326-20131121/10403_1 /TAXON_ID=1155430 /ORGANISM="Genus nov. species nov., Strain RCC2288" /LENGTH=611 /DNA_ID=CAMNT_0043154409 /DNA_START=58 /DNA_END=1893 /DNA_ORIENTATION=-